MICTKVGKGFEKNLDLERPENCEVMITLYN